MQYADSVEHRAADKGRSDQSGQMVAIFGEEEAAGSADDPTTDRSSRTGPADRSAGRYWAGALAEGADVHGVSHRRQSHGTADRGSRHTARAEPQRRTQRHALQPSSHGVIRPQSFVAILSVFIHACMRRGMHEAAHIKRIKEKGMQKCVRWDELCCFAYKIRWELIHGDIASIYKVKQSSRCSR